MLSTADPTRVRALALLLVLVVAILLVVALTQDPDTSPATPIPSAVAAVLSTPSDSPTSPASPGAATSATPSQSDPLSRPSSSPTEAPAASTSPKPSARAWTRLRADESGSRWRFVDQPTLWDFGDVLFLNPYADEGDGLWQSNDGVSWRRAHLPGLGANEQTGDFASVKSVARGPGGYVAVGAFSNDDTDFYEGRVWTSRDGSAWNGRAPEGVAGNSEGVPGSQELTLVGAADDGYVAFGSAAGGRMAWTSTDGIQWHPATDPSLKRIARTIVGITPIDGELVAFTTPRRERESPITVHRGSAFDEWRQVATLDASWGYDSAALARPGDPLTIIASTKGDRLGLWTSADGATWSRVGRLPDVLATSAIQVPTGWVAIGGLDISTGCTTLGPTIGLTWTSPDGRTWTRLQDDPSGVISTLAKRGSTLIGLGMRTTKHQGRPGAVWTMQVDAPLRTVGTAPTRVPDNVGCGG